MDEINIHGNDKEKLINFLQKTHEFIQYLYNNASEILPADSDTSFIIETDILANAWNQFDETFNIESEIEKIRSASDQTLIDHGLFGAQLTLKLTIIEKFYETWNSTKLHKFLKKLIDAIDNLLDSMIEAFSINGALKELKDAFGAMLDYFM